MNHVVEKASERRQRYEFTLTSTNTNVHYYGSPVYAKKRDIWPPISSDKSAERNAKLRLEGLDRLFAAPAEHPDVNYPTASSAELDNPYDPLYDGYVIRLVEILPGIYDDPLSLTFHKTDLQQKHLPYEALSYVWGEPSVKGRNEKEGKLLPEVILNGHHIDIPVNLEQALRQLRYKSKSRLVWADSVCINQLDVRERGHQVGLMSEVYSNAWRVVVWLGNVQKWYKGDNWTELEDLNAEQGFGAICEIVNEWLGAVGSMQKASFRVVKTESTSNTDAGDGVFDRFEIESKTATASDFLDKYYSSPKQDYFSGPDRWLSNATNVHFRQKHGTHDPASQYGVHDATPDPTVSTEDPKLTATENTASKSALWQAISKLYSCSWFWRLWVFQEIVLASSAIVRWGHCEIDWRFIGVASAILRTNYDAICERMKIGGVYNSYLMFRMSRTSDLPSMKLDFLRVLQLTRQFEVTDSRDRVFGLMGLSMVDSDPKRGELFLKPDYGMEYNAVLKAVAHKLIMQNKQLTLLSSVQYSSGTVESENPARSLRYFWTVDPSPRGKIPSWTPEWGSAFRATLSPWDAEERFSAGNGLETEGTNIEGDTLSVQGVEVGTIAHSLSFIWHDLDLSLIWSQHLQEFFTTEYGLRLLASTLTAGRNTYGSIVQDSDVAVADLSAYLLSLDNPEHPRGRRGSFHDGAHISKEARDKKREGADGPSTELLQRLSENGSATRFVEAAMTYSERRRLFITANGFLGLGPDTVREGDVLVVLAGSDMPFVLRPPALPPQREAGSDGDGDGNTGDSSGDSSDDYWLAEARRKHALRSAGPSDYPAHYLLVGESYVQGLMNGEVGEALVSQRDLAGPIDSQLLIREVLEKLSKPVPELHSRLPEADQRGNGPPAELIQDAKRALIEMSKNIAKHKTFEIR